MLLSHLAARLYGTPLLEQRESTCPDRHDENATYRRA